MKSARRSSISPISASSGLKTTTKSLRQNPPKQSRAADRGTIGRTVEAWTSDAADLLSEAGADEILYAFTPVARSSKSQDLASNAVWYGDEVPPEIVGELALALVEAGVQLQYFGPYVFATTRVNVIEIGYSRNEADATALTSEEIRKLAGIEAPEIVETARPLTLIPFFTPDRGLAITKQRISP